MAADPVRGPLSRTLADVPEGRIRQCLLASVNLLDNYTRGRVAEVLVAEFVGGDLVGNGYGSWDVQLGPTRIEVKSSGEIQSWPQKRRSRPTFSIAKASGWFEQPDGSFTEDPERLRRSDVYVFCHHRGTKPDHPAEWSFLVVPTERIDARCGDQTTITMASLRSRLEPLACGPIHLRAAVIDSVSASGRSSAQTREAGDNRR